MKRICTMLVAALCAVSVSSCRFVSFRDSGAYGQKSVKQDSNSKKMTVTYDVEEYDVIDVQIPCSINYSMSPAPLVKVSAPEALFDALKLEVRNGVLTVGANKNGMKWSEKVHLTLASSTLKSLCMNGSGSFCCDRLVTDAFSVDVNGSGEVSMDGLTCGDAGVVIRGSGDIDLSKIECVSLAVRIQGAGDVDVSGKADKADFLIQGAGDIDASGLETGDLRKRIEGVGKIKTRQR